MLVGRSMECALLDRLSSAARVQSQVLVLHGEAGVGKTALLEYLLERSSGCRVVRAAGIESEMELPFAGLHQMCAPMLDHLESLPGPQRDALGTAFGLSAEEPPDRFLVGLATLSLLADVAEEDPLVCVIDDAQWLDRVSAQTLAFVARRLLAERVAMVFAVRQSAAEEVFAGLPHLEVRGLGDSDARALLDSVMNGPVDQLVRDRIVAETHGNPLALLELPTGMTPAELAGGFGLPDTMPLANGIEQGFLRRIQSLPGDTQRLLLVAAAEPVGDVALFWRAAVQLGIRPEAVAPAEAAGVLQIGEWVRFRHPLVRSAAHRSADTSYLREVHRALAEVTNSDLDPDRRAWHLARATVTPDETVAAELARSAERAQLRGGWAAAAAFLERATALTPEPGRRARRALHAATAKQLAGAPQTALGLLATAASGPLSEMELAILQRLRGHIALDLRRGVEAVPLLLDAARQLESLDPALARETYLAALRAASIGGRLESGLREAAEAARNAPSAPAPRAIDLLFDGIAVRFTDGYAASAPILKRALVAVLHEDGRPGQDVHWPWLARRVAPDLFDDETWHALATGNVQLARDKGALAVLPLALNYLATSRIWEGDLNGAETLLEEADVIANATGTTTIEFGRVLLAAYRGDEARLTKLIESSEPAAMARGEGVMLTFSEYARAVLYNGLGAYKAALGPADSASAQDELMLSVLSLPELVESAARSGREELAAAALERLTERTRASGTEWALGIEARSRALLSEGGQADELYREAIDLLGRCRVAMELARAHLVYGEWLRRNNRRIDSRTHLRTAHEMYASVGAEAFTTRAARELLATGEKPRRRTDDTRYQLTAQEKQIAGLAAEGHTNSQIGAQLFLSPRTVEWHLSNVYSKLGISSRKELHTEEFRALAASRWEDEEHPL